jgi:hypothetical protein
VLAPSVRGWAERRAACAFAMALSGGDLDVSAGMVVLERVVDEVGDEEFDELWVAGRLCGGE